MQRLKTVASAVRTLLDGGTVPAEEVGALRDVSPSAPRPVQDRVPLLVGANISGLLAGAGEHGPGVSAVRSGAVRGGREVPPLEALAQPGGWCAWEPSTPLAT